MVFALLLGPVLVVLKKILQVMSYIVVHLLRKLETRNYNIFGR